MARAPVNDVIPAIEIEDSAGGQTSFPLPFMVFFKEDVVVTHTPIATGVGVVITEGVDYTVAGLQTDGGGSVEKIVATLINDKLKIVRNGSIKRISGFTGNVLSQDALNDEFDYMTLLYQEQEYRIGQLEAGLTPVGGINFGDLLDVLFTSLAKGDVVYRDATQFKNAVLADGVFRKGPDGVPLFGLVEATDLVQSGTGSGSTDTAFAYFPDGLDTGTGLITYEGIWVAGTYDQDDAVVHSGDIWAVTAVSTTDEPSDASSDWVRAGRLVSLFPATPVNDTFSDNFTGASIDDMVHGITDTGAYGKTIPASTRWTLTQLQSENTSPGSATLTPVVDGRAAGRNSLKCHVGNHSGIQNKADVIRKFPPEGVMANPLGPTAFTSGDRITMSIDMKLPATPDEGVDIHIYDIEDSTAAGSEGWRWKIEIKSGTDELSFNRDKLDPPPAPAVLNFAQEFPKDTWFNLRIQVTLHETTGIIDAWLDEVQVTGMPVGSLETIQAGLVYDSMTLGISATTHDQLDIEIAAPTNGPILTVERGVV